MKWIFIVNESAGRGKSKKIIPNIEASCKSRNIDFEIRYITKEKSGYDIASEYKEKEYVIYVVGGDGTLTLVLPALVGTKNKLGIIPAGSGNDTYRTIKNLHNKRRILHTRKKKAATLHHCKMTAYARFYNESLFLYCQYCRWLC